MTGQSTHAHVDAFYRARGKLLDSFARVESRLVEAIASAGEKAKDDTLGTKIKRLKDLRGDQLDKTVSDHLDRLNQLNDVRVDIVHGAMSLLEHDSIQFAVFINAKHAAEPIRPAIVLTLKTCRIWWSN